MVLRRQIQIEVTRRRYTPGIRSGSAIFSASPSAGARRCATAVDQRQRPSCLPSPAAPPSICRCPALSISMSRPPNISRLADGEIPVMLMFSGTCVLCGTFRGIPGCAYFLGEGDEIPSSAEDLERHDGAVLSRTARGCVSAGMFSNNCIDYKVTHGIPTWEEAIEAILAQSEMARA